MFGMIRRYLPGRLGARPVIVPVVRISGAIGIDAPLRPGVTLAGLAPALERAFGMKRAPCVALIINSPGGSPVQSHLIHRRIRALAAEEGKAVIAYVEDVAASGGYMIAAAADEIVADAASVVGSIGVVSQGFGFTGLLEKLGVERRVHTAGARKAILDPFRPEDPADIRHLEALQREIHAGFTALVQARRPNLATDEPDLFSGLFWTGETGLKLGLVDRLGDLRADLRGRYGAAVKPVQVGGGRRWPWQRRPGGLAVEAAARAGGAAAQTLAGAAEERALWARYGL